MRTCSFLLMVLALSAAALGGPVRTATPTLTVSALPSPSATPTRSLTHTISPTWTVSPTFSVSPTITLTHTPGEGSYTLAPAVFVRGLPGNEFDINYTAGATSFADTGGLISIFFPVEFGPPGPRFSVHPSYRYMVDAAWVSGQTVTLKVNGLAAGANIVFRFGNDPDGFIYQGTAIPTWTFTATPTRSHTFSPTISPTFTDVPPASTATVTPSISPTASNTPTPTQTPSFSATPTPAGTALMNLLVWSYPQSITQGAGGLLLVHPTFAIITATVTPTRTITPTSTITQTWTHSPTSTATPTITQTWTETPIGALQEGKVYAYPNPFDLRRFYKVTFRFPPDQAVLITVFNLLGEPVRELPAEAIQGGQGWAIWTGQDDYGRRVAGGLYYVRVRSASRVLVRKFTVLN